MTYEEAIHIKTQIGNSTLIEGKIWQVYIAPKNDKDTKEFMKRLSYYKSLDVNNFDELARKTCTNNLYRIIGVKFHGGVGIYQDIEFHS